jgi:hypothetical protein
MRGPYERGSGTVKLTALRVTSRFALVASSRALMAASTDCSVQKRKMQRPIARTVRVVRNQFFRRCLSR